MGLPIHGNFTFFSPAAEYREKSLFRYKAGTHMIDYSAKEGETWPGAITAYGDMPFYPISAIDRYGEQQDYDETGMNVWKKDPAKATEVIHPVSASYGNGRRHIGYSVFGSYFLAKKSKDAGARTLYLSVRNENYMDLSYVSQSAPYYYYHPVDGRDIYCVDVTLNITKYSKALTNPEYTDGKYVNASVAITVVRTEVTEGLKVPEIDNAIGKLENGTFANGAPRYLNVLEDDKISERSGEIISKTGDSIVIRCFLGYSWDLNYHVFSSLGFENIIGVGIRSTCFKLMCLGHMKYIETLPDSRNAARGIWASIMDSSSLLMNSNKSMQVLTTRDSQHHPRSLGLTSHAYFSVRELGDTLMSSAPFKDGYFYQAPTGNIFISDFVNEFYAKTSVAAGGRLRYVSVPFGAAVDNPETGALGDHDCYMFAVSARRLNSFIGEAGSGELVNPETFNFNSGYQILVKEGT